MSTILPLQLLCEVQTINALYKCLCIYDYFTCYSPDLNFFSTLDAVLKVVRILPLIMVLIQEFSFSSHFEIAPCSFERIARQSCAVCKIAQRSVELLEEHIANQASLQLVYKVTERVYYVTLTSPPVADNMPNAP